MNAQIQSERRGANQQLAEAVEHLTIRMNAFEEQAKDFQESIKEGKEMYDGIKSILRTFAFIERACVWLTKVGIVIGGVYASYKFFVAELIRNLTSKG